MVNCGDLLMIDFCPDRLKRFHYFLIVWMCTGEGFADTEVDGPTVLYCLIRMSTVLTSFPVFRDNRYTVT